MAFFQTDLPPSTASARRAEARAIRLPSTVRHARLISRLVFVLLVTGMLALLGISAARATESLAVGIIAADLAFLLAVAGWSAVYTGGRR
jgi:hypothetical protein